jgi:hypothetical protein
VWVGLDWRDYSDGVWYASNMEMIDTTNGFWYTPTAPITQFIHGVEVCGVMQYDTLNVYAYPLSIDNGKLIIENGIKIYPNPAKEIFVVEKVLGNKVQLVNMYRQIVQEQKAVNNSAVFNVANLPRGVYFVKGERQLGKLVLE